VRALILASALFVAAAACNDGPENPAGPNPPGATAPVRVLVFTATAGFRHDSIAAARDVMSSLGAANSDIAVTLTEDLSAISVSSLAAHDVVFFALTTGELALDGSQRRALLDFVDRGGGFMGAHSATDTLYAWPEYGRLIGAYFKEHPWTRTASVVVEDGAHPTTAALGASFSIREEFYTFRENPRPLTHVLLRLDAASVGTTGDYPLAWSHASGAGRVYYNALGHFSETWRDSRFQQQVIAAVRWTAGRL
jgi:type 1 glutamine amidotransferase